MLPAPAATLLFAHGGGFCKQVWDPIIRRLKSSPVLQQVATEFVAFDFPYHGSKRDESVAPKLDVGVASSAERGAVHDGGSAAPSAVVPGEIRCRRTKTRAHWRRPLDGGGSTLEHGGGGPRHLRRPHHVRARVWTRRSAEDGRGHELPRVGDAAARVLVDVEARGGENLKNFKTWDRESLAAYAQGALVEDEETGKTVLACHPQIEASLYCLKRPKCPIHFHYGDRSIMFFMPWFEHAARISPDIYSIDEPVNKCTHLLVLEDPETAANKILNDLAKVAPFRHDTSSRL